MGTRIRKIDFSRENLQRMKEWREKQNVKEHH